MRLPPRRHVALGADSSSETGAVWYAGEFDKLTVSIQSSTGSASRYTVVGTNQDGLQAALTTPSRLVPANNWSIVTVITAQGIYTIDPGIRWLNVIRDGISVSAASNATVTFTGSY